MNNSYLLLDQADDLAKYATQFHFPKQQNGEPYIYLVGHSLGLQPKETASHMTKELERWAQLGVRGHFEGSPGWMDYNDDLSEITAGLIGAERSEVTIMNTLTVNLHLLLASFYQPQGKRTKVLIEKNAFPSDRYAIESQIAWRGLEVQDELIEVGSADNNYRIDLDDVAEIMEQHGDQIALVMLGGINYYTGQLLDLAGITNVAQRHGCMVGFDLAHAIGNAPIDAYSAGFDFAVWCNYKYLNSGPGSLGGCFVHDRHRDREPALKGWWGHHRDTRFLMDGKFQPAEGAERWHLSTIPTFSLVPCRASLEIFEEVGMERLRKKSIALTGYLEHQLRALFPEQISIITPVAADQRGCQLSLKVRGASRDLSVRLRKRGVMIDWREPDVLRVAPTPLYNSYKDVWQFCQILSESLAP